MTVFRAQVSTPVDTLLPRDRIVINPCFNLHDIGGDFDAIANDLASGVQSWLGGGVEVKAALYDVEKPAPNRPIGLKVVGKDATISSSNPREISLCLSFYADSNVPRRRGRLYIPLAWLHKKAPGGAAQRPSAAQQTNAGSLASLFAGLGGANCDWVVWSKVDGEERKVSNWFVDDEWDIQRRRGSRSTSRITGTTSG